MERMPCGIDTLDNEMGGGVPRGSLNLLYGKTGTRRNEFTYTLANNISAMIQNPELIPDRENTFLPKKIFYTIFFEEKENILRDIKGTFSDEFFERFTNNVSFKSFSVSPLDAEMPEWALGSEKEGKEKKEEVRKRVLTRVVKFLEKNAESSLVFLHTLTGVARVIQDGRQMDITTSFIQFLQQLVRKKKGVIFAPLTEGIIPKDQEEAIISNADGIFEFEKSGKELRKRQDIMYVRKCRGVSSSLDEPFKMELTPSGIELERIRTLL